MPGELVVVKGDHRGSFAVVASAAVTVGRSSSDELSLPDDSKVSHHHAQVTPLGGERYLLEDLGSTNGTFVNGEKIEQVPLRTGDLIKIGRSLIVFRNAGSAVRLEDINLVGGGSSGSIARRERVESAATSSSPGVPEGSGASEQVPAQAYADLIRSAGEIALEASLQGMLDGVVASLPAGRAMVFLRHPITGGLGCASTACAPGFDRVAPVDPQILEGAHKGAVSHTDDRAAAPIMILGISAGVLYVDGCRDLGDRLGLLTAAAVLVGLNVGLDRSRQLASSATEIVGLAQAAVTRRSFDLTGQLTAAERLFAPAAARRSLGFELDAPAGIRAHADPILFGRGLDKLLGYTLADARGTVRVAARTEARGGASVTVSAASAVPREARERLLDPQGVAADLRRAGIGFGEGVLAVARVFFLRAGVRLTVDASSEDMAFRLDLDPPGADTERLTGGGSHDL